MRSRAQKLTGVGLEIKIAQLFRIRAVSATFEADDFDWGSPDENGEQYLMFFKDGEMLGRLAVADVSEIVPVNLLQGHAQAGTVLENSLVGIRHSIDRPKDTIYIVWNGEINVETWLNQVRQWITEPEWQAISRVFADAQKASMTFTTKDMKAVAALVREHAEQVRNKRVAVLANDLFGRVSTFSALIKPFGISMVVSNNLSTACTFLDLQPTETEQALQQLHNTLRNGTASALG